MPGDAAAIRGQCIRLMVATIITTLPGADEDAVRAQAQVICGGCGHPRTHSSAGDVCPRWGAGDRVACGVCTRDRFALLPSADQPRCVFCRARRWILARLADTPTAPVDPRLDPFIDALAATHDFPQLRQWFLRSTEATTVLTLMAHGDAPLTHTTLDAATGDRGGRALSLEHLRRMLVAAGALPARQEYLVRLEAALTRMTQQAPEHPDTLVLTRYIQWHLLPGVRRRLDTGGDPETTCRLARNALHGPWRLVTDLHAGGHEVASLTQPVLDLWLADHRSDTIPVSVFLRWGNRQRLAPRLNLPVQQMNDPMDFNDPDYQWQLLRRCLHDDTLSPRTRLAGALVLMYGQRASTIVQLRTSHVSAGPPTTLLLGRDAVHIDQPIATLLRQVADGTICTLPERSIAHSVDDQDGDRWLPGPRPGRSATRSLGRPARYRYQHRGPLAAMGRRHLVSLRAIPMPAPNGPDI